MLKELCEDEVSLDWQEEHEGSLEDRGLGDALYIARVRSWYRCPYSNLSAF